MHFFNSHYTDQENEMEKDKTLTKCHTVNK